MSHQKLGELLLQAGVIDEPQRRQALEKQQASGGRLGKILIEMRALDEETLTRTLARQLSLPVVRLRGRRIRDDVLQRVPAELIARHRCLPVRVDEDGTPTLLLAMEDPSDMAAIEEVAEHTGMGVKPVLAASSELDDAIWRHAPSDPGDSLACAEFLRDDALREEVPAPDLVSVQDDPAEPPLRVGDVGPERLAVPKQATAVASRPGVVPPAAGDLVLRALTQLLVEKGVITRQELIERLGALGAETPEDP